MHAFGAMAQLFWTMIAVNVALPFLTLWFRRVRMSPVAMLVISLLVNVGMWINASSSWSARRFATHSRSDWGSYRPGWPEVAIASATFAAFALLYLIFSKSLPLISLWEVKEGWRVDRWRRTGVIEVESDVPVLEPGDAVGVSATATSGART